MKIDQEPDLDVDEGQDEDESENRDVVTDGKLVDAGS